MNRPGRATKEGASRTLRRAPPRIDLVRATYADELGAAALLIRPDGYARRAADSSAVCGETLLAAITGGLARV
ncbi:hypothetical protein [Streptomyces sp. A5-4]|uniref:hypothetical protein n=1 Tax=Streptomyces sp. A5-4 TaxID=3384771 RepID=UPI003DA986BD